MNKRSIFFVISLLIVIALFGLLYVIGVINYFYEDSDLLVKFKFLDFGSKLLSLIYMVVLSIFFTVVMALMIKIIITPGDDSTKIKQVERKKNSDFVTNPDLIKDLVNLASETAYKQNEKRLIMLLEDTTLQERVDDIYYGISQMTSDVIESQTALELFEKILYWGISLSCSKRGSVMIADRENLNIYKTSGWKETEKTNLDKIKVKIGDKISGFVADSKKFLIVNNIDEFTSYNFPDKSRYETNSFISFPIVSGDRTIAVFNFTDNKKRGFYSVGEQEILKTLCELSVKMYEHIQLKKRISRIG